MSAKHSQSFWVGVFVALNLLSSVALAAPAAPAAPAAASAPEAPVTPVDPKKLVEQAEKALDSQDLDVALKFYIQAAELNYMPAQVAIGKMADAAQYYEEAVGWFLMAAMQGDAAGQYELGRMYQLGNGIEKDEAKAAYWYRRSAAQDYLPAVKGMAITYQLGGLGIKADPDKAKSWGAKAKRLEAIERKLIDEKLAAWAAQKKKIEEEEAAKKSSKSK